MNKCPFSKKLRQNRPLLLGLEAVGCLHMTGKAKIDFLRNHGGQKNGYKENEWYKKDPPLPLNDLLKWMKSDKFSPENDLWPDTFTDFLSKYSDKGNKGKGMLGLLQAGHAMASGIEKQSFNIDTVKYLGQDATHMWLSTAFGQPVRNLLTDPPELLTEAGWKRLLGQIRDFLTKLKRFGDQGNNCLDDWLQWRDGAIGPDGWLRKAFTGTLAETRLPNNDVTLFDQSYVAAALFKSAAAGAILEGESFSRLNNIKQQTRWRLLTIGIGVEHYEDRAVKIGDWTGARLAIDKFFDRVRKLVEVDLALGSLLYKDGGSCVFSFPGERFGNNKQERRLDIEHCKSWLTEEIDGYAREAGLETPPYCSISNSSRSLVGMTEEIEKAREIMAVPLHRDWEIPDSSNGTKVTDTAKKKVYEKTPSPDSSNSHVCPVCLVRNNEDRRNPSGDKQRPCSQCKKRRNHRLREWMNGNSESDSIWIDEIADANDRVALVTMNLDIEPWLDGTRLDAFRAQAIPEWRKFNPDLLKKDPNPSNPADCFNSLVQYIEKKLTESFNGNDPVLKSLQAGYASEKNYKTFFSKIVEDRTRHVKWNGLNHNARWLAHQLLRKLPSPGRIYRFKRQAEGFFKELLSDFRKIAAADQNRWRIRRLVIKPKENSSGLWENRKTYSGRHKNAPISLLYREETKDFLTVSNLARLLKPEEDRNNPAKSNTLELKDDKMKSRQLAVGSIANPAGNLGVYHPVISLESSPVRFRVLLPLEAVSDCVDRATEAWNDKFARIWDRLPLRIGIVAFPRMMPFQAVIEATRIIEDDLYRIKAPETWQVAGCETREGVTALSLVSSGPGSEHHRETLPVRFPDGREDVFYPYLAVEDKEIRSPLDFQHPDGQTYRHATNLQSGDGVRIYPSLVTTVFMDSTAKRFEPIEKRKHWLSEWRQMRELWRLIDRHAPSRTALHGAWSELIEKRENWKRPDGTWPEGGKEAWLDLVRVIFHERLGVPDACLESLVQASGNGLLEWSLEWHMNVLKKKVSGGKR